VVCLFSAGLDESEIFELGESALEQGPEVISIVIERIVVVTYIVFDSSSSSVVPAIALKADHKSLTFINAPDSRYI
jgi:hypothetical protein